MVEASPGVFVGNPNRRVRNRLWELARIGYIQVIVIEPSANEHGWAVRTAGQGRWQPVDFDGLILSARFKKQLNAVTPPDKAPAHQESAPRPRGCSPPHRRPWTGSERRPRARGDAPTTGNPTGLLGQSAPRPRGCSPRIAGRGRPGSHHRARRRGEQAPLRR
ncbi:type I-E CRISPR-associated endoribonuclease Cas2 [Streptomyces sp. NPDC002338]